MRAQQLAPLQRSASYPATTTDVNDLMLETANLAIRDTVDAVWTPEQGDDDADAVDRFKLAADLAEATGDLRSIYGAGPSTSEMLANALSTDPRGDDVVVISLIVDSGGRRVLAVGIRQQDLWVQELSLGGSYEKVEEYAEDFHGVLNGESFPDVLEKAFDDFIRPIQDHIIGADLLYFIPDRITSEFPFWAFRDRATGEYLIDLFEVELAPSGGVLRWLIERPRRSTGCIGIGSCEPELSWAVHKEDLSHLFDRLRDNRTVLSEFFTSDPDLISHAGGMRSIIYVIAHGHAGGADGQSYFVVTPESGVNDGERRITAGMLLESRWKAELLFLNSCSLGSGQWSGGERLGFSFSALGAGSGSLIAPLVQAEISFAQKFALAVFRHLGERSEQGPVYRSTAFALAMRDALHRTAEFAVPEAATGEAVDAEDVSDWAPFSLWGDFRPLSVG